MKRFAKWSLIAGLAMGVCPVDATAQESIPVATSEELEVHFDLLTVGVERFEDVWVHRQTNAVILIRHSRGIHTINLTDLPTAEWEELERQVGNLAQLPEPEPTWRDHPLVLKMRQLFTGESTRTPMIAGTAGGMALLLGVAVWFGRKRTSTA